MFGYINFHSFSQLAVFVFSVCFTNYISRRLDRAIQNINCCPREREREGHCLMLLRL